MGGQDSKQNSSCALIECRQYLHGVTQLMDLSPEALLGSAHKPINHTGFTRDIEANVYLRQILRM